MAAPQFSAIDHAGPATHAEAVTPNDTTRLGQLARGLYVGGTGNLSLLMQDGSSVTFANVPSGSVLSVRCARVNATGTTATNLVALY